MNVRKRSGAFFIRLKKIILSEQKTLKKYLKQLNSFSFQKLQSKFAFKNC